jgi:cell division septum initiation protein DivIVA
MTNNKQQTEMKLYTEEQVKQILDDLLDYINSLQNNYIALSKNDKKKSKQVDAILTATTLIKMRIQSLNK